MTGSGATQHIHSGSEAVVFRFYFDGGAIAQSTSLTVASSNIYEFSTWALIDDASGNGAHTEAPIFALSVWTSPTVGGTYTYRAGLFSNQPATVGAWEQFTATFDGSSAAFAPAIGHFMQVRIAKTNDNTTHRMYFDDAEFGIQVPEPAVSGLLLLAGPALCLRRRKA